MVLFCGVIIAKLQPTTYHLRSFLGIRVEDDHFHNVVVWSQNFFKEKHDVYSKNLMAAHHWVGFCSRFLTVKGQFFPMPMFLSAGKCWVCVNIISKSVWYRLAPTGKCHEITFAVNRRYTNKDWSTDVNTASVCSCFYLCWFVCEHTSVHSCTLDVVLHVCVSFLEVCVQPSVIFHVHVYVSVCVFLPGRSQPRTSILMPIPAGDHLSGKTLMNWATISSNRRTSGVS